MIRLTVGLGTRRVYLDGAIVVLAGVIAVGSGAAAVAPRTDAAAPSSSGASSSAHVDHTIWSTPQSPHNVHSSKGDASPQPGKVATVTAAPLYWYLPDTPLPPPAPVDWTPTQAEVDGAVEAKTGVAAPGLPNGGHNCFAQNYGTSTGSEPPAEDFIDPDRPAGATVAFVAYPILNGLFVQYYACWPLD